MSKIIKLPPVVLRFRQPTGIEFIMIRGARTIRVKTDQDGAA